MPESKFVLVTGATGQQGGAVVTALLKRGHRVRGLTRNVDSPKAKALAERGVEVVQGDFQHPDALKAATAGVDAVFGMTTPFEAGIEAETGQGVMLVDAIKSSGVEHLVFSSVASADQKTNVPHFDSKFRVEEYIVGSGINYTIMAPVSFVENFLSPWFIDGIRSGTLSMALPAERKLQHIVLADIGAFAVALIERGSSEYGKRYDIASEEVTGEELVETLSRVWGRDITYSAFPAEALKEQSEDFFLMFDWFDKVGYVADIHALRNDFPEVAWHSIADWAKSVSLD